MGRSSCCAAVCVCLVGAASRAPGGEDDYSMSLLWSSEWYQSGRKNIADESCVVEMRD